MMTKQDFEAIARRINAVPERDRAQSIEVLRAIMEACAASNPRFDRQRFMLACGIVLD